MSLGPASAIGGSRTPRDERIRELKAARWSLRQIAVEVHLSPEHVRRILRAQSAQRALSLDGRRQQVLAELAEIESRMALKIARRNQLRRELLAIDEELESGELDRLLGLDGRAQAVT